MQELLRKLPIIDNIRIIKTLFFLFLDTGVFIVISTLFDNKYF